MAGFKFRRQHPFGDFILDFVCIDRKLVVEVDGGQHTENAKTDKARTERLLRAGFSVLRFWNHEVFGQPHPHPGPLPEGEGIRKG